MLTMAMFSGAEDREGRGGSGGGEGTKNGNGRKGEPSGGRAKGVGERGVFGGTESDLGHRDERRAIRQIKPAGDSPGTCEGDLAPT